MLYIKHFFSPFSIFFPVQSFLDEQWTHKSTPSMIARGEQARMVALVFSRSPGPGTSFGH
jgi:hypothetical protein